MKKNKFVTVILCLCILFGCSKINYPADDNKISNDSENVEEIICAMPGIEIELAKSSISGDGTFSWSAGDEVVFYPKVSELFKGVPNGVLFQSAESGPSTKFIGNGWGLLRGKKYYGCYPADVATAYDMAIADYSHQSQSANNDSGHLPAVDYLHTAAIIPESGPVSFSFDRLGVFMKLTLVIPADKQNKVFKSFYFKSDENIFTAKASFDLSNDTPTFQIEASSNKLSLSLGENGFIPEDGSIVLYLMMAPTNWMGHAITAALVDEDKIGYQVEFTPTKNQVAGKGYSSTLSMVCTNEIDPEFLTIDLDVPTITDAETATLLYTIEGVKEMRIDNHVVTPMTTYNFAKAGEHIVNVAFYNNTITKSAFCGSDISSVSIPDMYTSIPESAFENCENLQTVAIPSTLVSLGKYAFKNCSALETVNLPETVTSFGEKAFYGCSSLASFTGPYAKENGSYIIVNNEIQYHAPGYNWPTRSQWGITCKYCPIPSYVTKDYLAEEAEWYTYMENAESAEIPYASKLKLLFIPGSKTTLMETDTHILHNQDLIYVSLNCEIIPFNGYVGGPGCIYSCPNLLTVSFGADVRKLYWTCIGCDKLAHVNFSEGITTLQYNCFTCLPSLLELKLPDSIEYIGDFCFSYCQNLQKLYIGANVKYLGDYMFSTMFAGENHMNSLYIAATVPPEGYALNCLNSDCKIYVPTESVDAYKTSPLWENFVDNIYGIDYSNFDFNAAE